MSAILPLTVDGTPEHASAVEVAVPVRTISMLPEVGTCAEPPDAAK